MVFFECVYIFQKAWSSTESLKTQEYNDIILYIAIIFINLFKFNEITFYSTKLVTLEDTNSAIERRPERHKKEFDLFKIQFS